MARTIIRFKSCRVPNGALFAIFLIAVGIAAWPHRDVPGIKLQTKLADLFSFEGEVPGWTSERHPVAETEEMKRVVAEVLNYDDAVYTVYESTGGVRISFYAAYWKPGKMSHRLVASHTPDVCWVGGGWRCLTRGTESLSASRGRLVFEHRVFEQGGRVEHVMFCHLVGGRELSYRTGQEPPWHAVFTDIFKHGTRQREEQVFIRISSNRSFGEFKDSAPVQLFVQRLLGVIKTY